MGTIHLNLKHVGTSGVCKLYVFGDIDRSTLKSPVNFWLRMASMINKKENTNYCVTETINIILLTLNRFNIKSLWSYRRRLM